jgi:hypothetical protein
MGVLPPQSEYFPSTHPGRRCQEEGEVPAQITPRSETVGWKQYVEFLQGERILLHWSVLHEPDPLCRISSEDLLKYAFTECRLENPDDAVDGTPRETFLHEPTPELNNISGSQLLDGDLCNRIGVDVLLKEYSPVCSIASSDTALLA